MNYEFKRYLKEQAGVTDQQIEQIGKHIQKKFIEKGEILLHKGQVCKNFFYVEKGLLRFYSINKKEKENILEFAPEKWLVLDRASFYFDEPSEFYIDGIEPTTVAVLDEEFINITSEISPQFRKYNERILQNHIRHLQKRIDQLIGTSAEERYLDFVERYPDLTLRVPQWMIASYLGITPESLSRVRRDLANKSD
jgi:CRP-like cAMP-binding protein